MKATILFLSLLLGSLSSAQAGTIPPQKLALIQKAMEVMRIKSRMESYIGKIVDVKVKRIQNDSPRVADSVLSDIRATISGVYRENLESENGLYPQLYQVVDKYLMDDDLKFVVNYNGSDGGQRYAKLAPRIVQEASEVERRWGERLEPLIKERLKKKFGR